MCSDVVFYAILWLFWSVLLQLRFIYDSSYLNISVRYMLFLMQWNELALQTEDPSDHSQKEKNMDREPSLLCHRAKNRAKQNKNPQQL